MAMIVDVRGLACPQPVIQTRKAMQERDRVVTLVDNESSLTNVSRMAEKAGWRVEATPEGTGYRIDMVKGSATPEVRELAVGRAEVASGPLVLVVASDIMGRPGTAAGSQGDMELGSILIRGFFHTLGEVKPLPQTIIFFNSGVKLACEGSPVLDDLCALEAEGIEMLVCGTCLNYLELTEKLTAGQVSNMYDIAEAMLGAGKVVHL